MAALPLLLAAPAKAQDWGVLNPAFGQGYAACTPDPSGFACLALICSQPGWGFDLRLLRGPGAGALPGHAVYRIDGKAPGTSLVQRLEAGPGFMANSLGSAGFDAALPSALANGQVLDLVTDRSRRFGLAGYRFALETVAKTCLVQGRGPLGLDDLATLARQEAERWGPRAEEWQTREIKDWAATGPVLTVGATTPRDCGAQCRISPACFAASHTPDGTCRLLADVTGFEPMAGARNVLIKTRPSRVFRTAIPGPVAAEATGLRWQTGDTLESYLSRLRTAAMPFGADCPTEAAAVDRLAGQMHLDPIPAKLQVGEVFELGWQTAEALSQRVPAWLVITSDKPVRFSGEGFFALLPGAIGPFGVGLDADRHRAFVPLFEGNDITRGKIGITPLVAGPQTLGVTLVAWHRACLQERPAARMETQITVTPGKAELLVQDPVARPDWTRRVAVPAFQRDILFSRDRILLRDSSYRTEILSRGAKDARLSPTQRFLVITTEIPGNELRYEIIDIVDGTRVLDLIGENLDWWNGDSFVLTNSVPFGRVRVHTTARPAALTDTVETAGSCCASDGTVRMTVDLENALVQINDSAFSLLDGTALARRTPVPPEDIPADPLAMASAFGAGPEEQLGTVAPLNGEDLWNTPLGPFTVHPEKPFEDSPIAITPVGQPAAVVIDAAEQTQVAQNVMPPTLRGFSAAAIAATRDGGLRRALLRWGVMTAPESLPQAYALPKELAKQHDDKTEEQAAAYSAGLRRLVETDLTATSHYADWATYEEQIDKQAAPGRYMSYCNYSPTMEDIDRATTPQMRAALTSEADLDLAQRFEPVPGRVIWLLRSYCLSGPTGDVQTVVSSFNIFDSAYAEPNLAMHRVESFFAMRTGYQTGIAGLYETDFQAKLVGGRLIVTHAPGRGVMMVYDLVTRKFLLREGTAWKGDLLQDVFVDAGLKTLFQVNSDNTFAVYPLDPTGVSLRTETAKPALYGRYLDDELVVWTDDFRFDATQEGASFVGLRFPGVGGEYALDQFGADRHVGGLLRKVIGGASLPTGPALAPPPRVIGSLSRGRQGLTGFLQWSDTAKPSEIRVFIDGRQSARFAVSSATRVQQINLPLPPGARWATAVAVDAQGQSSRPVSVDLGRDPSGAVPRTHFLGVGIDRYADPALPPLNYGKSDVLMLSKALAALDKRTIALISNTVIADRRATPEAILAQARAIVAAAQPGDHLVLHFAGHGLQDAKGGFYLAGPTTRLDDLAGTALAWSSLAQVFAGHDLRVTVLLDACHAGAATLGGNDGAVDALRQTMPPGLTVIAAAKGRQTSGEDPSVGGGLFSAAAAKVLGAARGQYDSNQNGVLEAVEFYRGVKTLVTARRGAEQTPWLARNQAVGENGLF